ncbi:hypothetical protein [Conexibacter sp. S30A1]|nr:hypothetical protein [Conexibacter sp. S30A1]
MRSLCVPPARAAEDVLAIAKRVIGPDQLKAKAQFLVQSMFPTETKQ